MARLVVSVLFGLALCLAAGPVWADESSLVATADDPSAEQQEQSQGQQDDFGAEHRQRIYEQSRLDQRRAVLYSLALPGLGNYYAEQYALGTVALMSMVFTTMFLVFGLTNDHPDLVRIGAVTGGVTYVGSALTSYMGVRSHNDQLRRNLHIGSERFAPRGDNFRVPSQPRTLTIGWRWQF